MEKYILLLVFLMILLVVAVSGCLSLEDEYENSILSFKIPENWTVVDATNLDILAGLKPVALTPLHRYPYPRRWPH